MHIDFGECEMLGGLNPQCAGSGFFILEVISKLVRKGQCMVRGCSCVLGKAHFDDSFEITSLGRRNYD